MNSEKASNVQLNRTEGKVFYPSRVGRLKIRLNALLAGVA